MIAGVGIGALWIVGLARPRFGFLILFVWALLYGALVHRFPEEALVRVGKDVLLVLLLGRAAAALVWRGSVSRPQFAVGAIVLFWLIWAMVLYGAGINNGPFFEGIRFTFEWLGILFIVSTFFVQEDWLLFLKWLLPLVLLSALTSIWQRMVGVDALIASGYEYGAELRHIQTSLRSFGTVGSPNAFGLTCGTFLVAYMAALLNGKWLRSSYLWLAGAGLSVIGIVLSVNRTAALAAILVLLGVACARSRRSRRAVTVVLVASLVGAAALAWSDRLITQAGGSASFFARLEIWAATIDSAPSLLTGAGAGSIGVALASSVDRAPSLYGVTDNYYVASIFQYGLPGLVFLISLLGVVWHGASQASNPVARAMGTWTVAYVSIAMLAMNVWEDFPVMIVAWSAVGLALSPSMHERSHRSAG